MAIIFAGLHARSYANPTITSHQTLPYYITEWRPLAEIHWEIFLAIYQKAKSFQGDSAFSTWLYRLTLNVSLARLRRRKSSTKVNPGGFLPCYREDGHHQVRPVFNWTNREESTGGCVASKKVGTKEEINPFFGKEGEGRMRE
ncbi:sigma factor [Candidatus Methylomirabilis sp.]|uniref:sigma factor n=1 Tax=Candidatus Methylomirabilis sp. TaxID=2032687 RepID=UPI002A64D468|nr:sigma factor [Candidatus Methylomirabilis sp.]